MSAFLRFIERNMEDIEMELLVGLSVVFVSWLGRQMWRKYSQKIKILEVFSSHIPQSDISIVTDLTKETVFKDESIYFKGSVLKTVVENSSLRSIMVKHAWLMIDKVQSFEERQLVILGDLIDNQFWVYVVNNGYTDIDNIKITLTGNYDLETGKAFLKDEQLAKLFCNTVENIYFTIPKLESGEIKKIASFFIDIDLFHEYSRGKDWIYICKKVTYDFCAEKQDEFLASIVWIDNHLAAVYCQGGESDVETYYTEIDSKGIFPEKKELPIEFSINPEACKQIQVVTYVNKSSTITYHFELEIAGKKKLVSKKNMINIAVPIYETNGGFYHILREWLIENKIFHYRYNESPLLQKKIEHRNPIKCKSNCINYKP